MIDELIIREWKGERKANEEFNIKNKQIFNNNSNLQATIEE